MKIGRNVMHEKALRRQPLTNEVQEFKPIKPLNSVSCNTQIHILISLSPVTKHSLCYSIGM